MPRFVLRRQVAPEPTRLIVLRWGDYRGRYLVGIALMIGGAALIAQTTAYTFSLGLLGSALHAAGWIVQPARAGRRALVVVPCVLFCWTLVTGPQSAWMLSFVLVCWLFVRRRPIITYSFALIPAAAGLAMSSLFSSVAAKTPAFAIMVACNVAAAWLAREYALRVRLTA